MNSQIRFVQITDVNGSPSIVIEREHGEDHDDAVSPKWMKHEAWLLLGDDRIRGKCKVRAVPVFGDDEHGEVLR